MNNYRPGHCNIGPEQRRRRLLVAAGAFGLAVATALGYVAGVVPAPLLVSEFVFLAVAFEWGLQAYSAFCVRLAMRSRYDFGDDTGTVAMARDRRADQLQAAKLTVIAVGLAAVTTAGLVAVLA